MTFTNIEVKIQAAQNGVKLFELPKQLGISESTFYRLMRVELNDADRQRVLKAIREIAAERVG